VFAVLVFWIVVYWLVALSANEKTPFLGKLSSWGLMGLLLGFTAQFVATVLMLVPLALVALGVHAFHAVSAQWRMRGFAAVLLIAGVGVGTSPSWLHNTLVAREPVFLSAHEGINFFLGNHASSDGYTSIPAGLRRSQDGLMEDSLKLPEVETGRPMRRSECSAWWKARANRWIAENPDAWRALLIKKVANFWNIYEFDDLNAIAPWLEMGLVPPGFRFGHFAFLALAALPLVLYRCGPGRWVAAGVLMLSLAILPVFVTERYRLTALPGLIVLAVCGVTLCVTSIRTRRWVSVASVAIFAVPCALLVFAPRNSPVLIARIDHPVGLRLLERSQQVEDPGERQDLRRRGVERLRNAHKLLPRDSEIAFAYANGLLLDGKTGESEGLYRQILASLKDSQGRPTHLGAVNNLSMLLSQAKRHAEAEPLLERSLEIEPGEANTWMRLAEVRLALGKKDLAKAAVKEALRLRPGTQGYLQFEQKLNAAP
jgi:tetratricopeptide (TPR) repeat protein